MAKPAARAQADFCAHNGPIKTGSPDVTIGGFPAARKGDTFICSEHGPGVIAGGSRTVFINGVPAARIGDITSCKVEALPPTTGKKPDANHYLTPVRKINKDGSVKSKIPDNLTMRMLSLYSIQSDESGDGSFDQIRAGIALTEFQFKNHWGGVHEGFDTEWGSSVLKAESTTGYTDKDGEYGVIAKSKATGISGNASIGTGKKGSSDYTNAKAEGVIGYADAKAEGRIYTGGNDEKYGFAFELGAEAAAAHGEIEAESGMKYFSAKGTLGGSAGSIGANAGVTGFFDKKNWVLELKVSGELAFLLGIKGDLSLRLGDYDTPDENLGELQGAVLSGLPIVIIGG
ncbi:PAAR domain-containing protein [Erwiniaceae bacterium CAU 1747]